jgi:hypothetical protein
MEDVVAVRVRLESGIDRYFLTWVRIQARVDPTALEAILLRHSADVSLGGVPVSAHLCGSLQDAAAEPYFYEGLFHLAQKKIPYGPRYEAWRKKKEQEIANGKELYYLGQYHPDV